MALIRCPECNHEISDTAKFCPNCGYVMKQEEPVQPEPVKEPEKVKVPKPKKEKKSKPDKKSVVWGLIGLLFTCIGGLSDPPIIVYVASAIAIIIGIFNLVKHPRWKPLSVVVIILSLWWIAIYVWNGFDTYKARREDQKEILSELPKDNVLDGTNIELKKITYKGVSISIPKHFTPLHPEDGIGYGDSNSMIYVIVNPVDADINPTESEVKEQFPEILDKTASLGDFGIIEKVDSYESNIPSAISMTNKYRCKTDGQKTWLWVSGIYNPNTRILTSVVSLSYDSATAYNEIYDSILDSIEVEGTDQNDINSKETGSEVSSNIKELADGFESFMNKYIDFMVSVKNKNSLSALSEYTQLLAEYSDWMTKIDNVDTSQLSDTDAAYFMEVYARVMGKLASAGLSN